MGFEFSSGFQRKSPVVIRNARKRQKSIVGFEKFIWELAQRIAGHFFELKAYRFSHFPLRIKVAEASSSVPSLKWSNNTA